MGTRLTKIPTRATGRDCWPRGRPGTLPGSRGSRAGFGFLPCAGSAPRVSGPRTTSPAPDLWAHGQSTPGRIEPEHAPAEAGPLLPSRPGRLASQVQTKDTSSVENTIAQLTEKLLASYREVGGINHLDGQNLPSKRAIVRITQELLCLLFPGFFEERPIPSAQIKTLTARRLRTVATALEREIYRSLVYMPPPEYPRKSLRAAARSITLGLLDSLPRLREILQTDIEAAYNGDPAALSREEVIVAYPFVETIAVQRLAHELYLAKVPLIPRIMTEWAHSRSGMDLHPGAQIGTHFFVDHCTGTVVGETAIIGNHVKMYQGVGLVARSLAAGQALKGQKRHPTIEDHVTIYAGATIMGGDTVVGAGSTIGANVFLTTSVPPRSLVVQKDANIRVMSKGEHVRPEPDVQI